LLYTLLAKLLARLYFLCASNFIHRWNFIPFLHLLCFICYYTFFIKLQQTFWVFGFLFSNMRAGSRFLSSCFDNCRTLTYGNVWCRHLAIVRVLNYVTGKNLNTCDTITYILTGWQHRFTFWDMVIKCPIRHPWISLYGWGCYLFLTTEGRRSSWLECTVDWSLVHRCL